MKKRSTFWGALFLLGSLAAHAENEEKRWALETGVSHIERQQGRVTGRGHEGRYDATADDLNEDGDVTSIYTKLGYKINDKWSVDYKYSYDYIDNNERFGKYRNDKGGIDSSDKDSGQFIEHTVRLIRNFEPFNLVGKEWDSSVWVGYRNYRESSIEGGGDYQYYGYSSNRIIFYGNMNTNLTAKTNLDLNFNYQYRTYNNDDDGADVYQHRQYYTVTLGHNFTDNLYMTLENTLYVRQHVQSGHNRDYGEWDYAYTFGHNYDLGNNYTLNSELTAWGEVSLWEKGTKDVANNNQAEILGMPKIKKVHVISEDLKISGFIGAGYVYGYDTRTSRKTYAGFEGRLGAAINYNF